MFLVEVAVVYWAGPVGPMAKREGGMGGGLGGSAVGGSGWHVATHAQKNVRHAMRIAR